MHNSECDKLLAELTEADKNAFYQAVALITTAVNCGLPQAQPLLLKQGFHKLFIPLSNKCPKMSDLGKHIVVALMLDCIDDFILQLLRALDKNLPDIVDYNPKLKAAKHRKNILDAEERHQAEINRIEKALRENDWKDQKDGKYEKQLTLMHAISRSRDTPLALKSVNVPQEKNESFGNSRKYKNYMLSTIDTKLKKYKNHIINVFFMSDERNSNQDIPETQISSQEVALQEKNKESSTPSTPTLNPLDALYGASRLRHVRTSSLHLVNHAIGFTAETNAPCVQLEVR